MPHRDGMDAHNIWLLPMLGINRSDIPAYQDVYIADEYKPEHDDQIQIYARAGGANRAVYATEIDALKTRSGYTADYDDTQDPEYATFVFAVPSGYQDDFDKIKAGDNKNISSDLQTKIKLMFPDRTEFLDGIFGS